MPCPGSGAASSILRLTHNEVMAGPPDVTPAVDHHVRLATTPSIGIAGQNWAEIAAGVSADRSGYLSTVMHWALASSQHSLDVLIIEHGSRRAIASLMGGEPAIVVERRKELTYLLCQAAELERRRLAVAESA
jgi:hypothetical protein